MLPVRRRNILEANSLQAAERILVQSGGVNMNTWVVGHTPVGHAVQSHATSSTESQQEEPLGRKTFFMKARIMAGKPELSGNQHGFQDHRWLARNEIEPIVGPDYWKAVRNMLVEI